MTSAEKESVLNESYDLEHNFATLVNIFPNIDAKYIRKVCENPPFNNIDDDLVIMLINHLLNYDNKINISDLTTEENMDLSDQIMLEDFTFQELKQNEKEIQELEHRNNELFAKFIENENMKQQLNILINIFPDADPESLEKFIKTNHNSTNSLEEFVEYKLMNKDYPKRSTYFSQMKKKENIEKFVTNFKVTEFLKEFPEPFEYFENQKRKCNKEKEAISFLMSRYKNFDEKHINEIYELAKFNLSIADRNLQNNNCNNSVQFNIDISNVALLKEIAFIQNKTQIEIHLKLIKKKEEEEVQFLREQKLLFDCQCCFNEVKPYECIECENDHIFCNNCVTQGTKLAISNGQTRIQCFTECDKEISLNTLRKILPIDIFDMFLKKCQEQEVCAAKLDDLVNCPFCTFSMELSKEITIFSCKNPECMKISCRLCKKLHHLPIKCEDILDENKARLYVEEQMSAALIRKCNKCLIPFIKIEGCNKMTCQVCGAMMCYLCRKPVDYGHFKKPNGCSLNQDSNDFDQEQINLRRVIAVQTLNQEFPNLNFPTL